MSTLNRKKIRQKVHRRIRKKVSGTAAKPRLAVHFSNKNVYAQVIDDFQGNTVVSASSMEKELRDGLKSGSTKDAAAAVGKLVAERAVAKGLNDVVFDRGSYLFHGRVKALADAAREAGLKF